MTNLGGHCYETLCEAFEDASRTDARTCFLACARLAKPWRSVNI